MLKPLSGKSRLPKILPELKTGVVIEAGGMDFNQTPTWVIHDKLSNQFFHIGWNEYQLISKWAPISPIELLLQLGENQSLLLTEEDIESVFLFLQRNCLIKQNYESIKMLSKNKKQPWYLRLAKGYLFFRIPLLKPDAMLIKAYPYVAWVLSIWFMWLMLIFGLIGLVFLVQRFDSFSHTFFDLFTFEFVVLYAVAIVVAKTSHEFGHAFTCKKYGLKVPNMGVAFLVMFPMLYTDTHESWKLKSSKQRAVIGLAGVKIEFYVAVVSLWLWMILPNGALKSTCFFLCTYSLLTTVLINISPFLRFDGYYILSDMLSMRNLQTRSFALARWWLRETLFGLNDFEPEKFSKKKKVLLLIYAFATWLYRFVLFIGIAFLVYYFFFKVLGLILFVIEVYYFIFKPIFFEINVWWKMKNRFTINKHSIISLFALILLLSIFFIPFKKSLYLQATVSNQIKTMFAYSSAKIVKVLIKNNQQVAAGQVLVQLSSPVLDFSISQTNAKIITLEWKVRNIGVFQNERDSLKVLYSELNDLKSKLNGLMTKRQDLTLKAPFPGIISQLSPNVSKGIWVSKNQKLFVIINPKILNVQAVADYNQFSQLYKNSQSSFIPDNINLKILALMLKNVTPNKIESLSTKNNNFTINKTAYLASTLGGQIASVIVDNKIIPVENSYIIVYKPEDHDVIYKIDSIQRGYVVTNAKSKSYAQSVFETIYGFLIKESAF